MMKVRTHVTEKVFNIMLLIVVFILCPIACKRAAPSTTSSLHRTVAEANAPLEDAVQQPCETKCGCDEIYIYDAVNDLCLINFKKAMKKVIVRYDYNVEVLPDNDMAKSIYIEGEKLFQGIMISVILFITCASVCVVSACIYCCRINYTDRTLKNNVKGVAKKLNRDYTTKKIASKRVPLPPMAESCGVVVEPAGLFVV